MKSKLYFVSVSMFLIFGAFRSASSPCVNASRIEWLSFKGSATPAGNLLTWTIAPDVNTKGFEIERLYPNNIGWETLGFVNSNSKTTDYQYIDNQPFAMSYYRLRAVDSEGNKMASVVLSVLAQRAK
jgi:hypothetical protein